jgi:phosphomannomutase
MTPTISKLIVSISGLRGIVGESLTPDVVVRYAAAYSDFCGKGTIVIGRDGRFTGKLIAEIATSTLLAKGCDVVDLGVCPTPTVQLAVECYNAAGGIAVTASHNPIEWNGLKFLASSGMFLDADENMRFLEMLGMDMPYADWASIGKFEKERTFSEKHVDAVLRLKYVNVEQIRSRKFKVVVDCINAAGSKIVPGLLKRFGCEVVTLNCDGSGVFPHIPEPLPENLTELCKRVVQEGADLGIAVDPDVDRLVLITEKGEAFGEEYTIAQAVRFVLMADARSNRGDSSTKRKVVINLSTTRAVEDIAKEFDAEVVRTPVGEINVAKRMKAIGAIVGGEGSGGVILPEVHLGRDALVGIGLTLQHLLEFGGRMSELRSSLPGYFIVKKKIELKKTDGESVLDKIKQRYASEKTNTDDGIRIDYPDYWVHLRKSNTEPIIRIVAEARTGQEAGRVAQRFVEEVRGIL